METFHIRRFKVFVGLDTLFSERILCPHTTKLTLRGEPGKCQVKIRLIDCSARATRVNCISF